MGILLSVPQEVGAPVTVHPQVVVLVPASCGVGTQSLQSLGVRLLGEKLEPALLHRTSPGSLLGGVFPDTPRPHFVLPGPLVPKVYVGGKGDSERMSDLPKVHSRPAAQDRISCKACADLGKAEPF